MFKLKDLYKPTDRERKLHVGTAVLTFALAAIAVATAAMTRPIYDKVLPNKALESLVAVAIALVVGYVIDIVVRLVRGFWQSAAAETADTRIVVTLFRRVLGARMEDAPRSHAAANLLPTCATVRDAFSGSGSNIAQELISVGVLLSFMALLCGWLALVPLLSLPFLVGAVLVRRRMVACVENGNYSSTVRARLVQEASLGLEDVKALRAEELLASKMETLSMLAEENNSDLQWFSLVSMTLTTAASYTVTTGTLIAGAWLIIEGWETMGSMIFASILAQRINASLLSITSMASKITSGIAAMETLDHIAEAPQEDIGKSTDLPLPAIGSVEIESVTFCYKGTTATTLKDFNLNVPAGAKLALIGPVGCGKTTVLRLIEGFLDLKGGKSTGTVKVDNRNIAQVRSESLHAVVGYLPQDTALFTDSIGENLRMGKPDATDADLFAALEVCGAKGWVDKLDDGLDTLVIEGGRNFSGGQRQQLALARLVVTDPKIVLFDEPTAHLDEQTEAAWIASMAPWLANRTVIIATHRLNVLALTDITIPMKDGQAIGVFRSADVLNNMRGGKPAEAIVNTVAQKEAA
jgi:ATP-binding cassette subfamily C protein LapB